MHIPMQVDYGVRALVDLAAHQDKAPVRAIDIARRQHIPEPYLAQVLHSLQKHGLTRSQRGPQGGHSLATDPAAITMGMVMRYLGGPARLIGCLDDAGTCDQSPACGQRSVWGDVEEAIQSVLDSKNIAELVEHTRVLTQKSAGQPSSREMVAGPTR